MLNKKPHIENHKHIAESKLTARLELLKSQGKTAVQIKRDPTVRHFRAEASAARNQLADIAKLESQIARKAEVKSQKLAAPKAEHPKSKRSGLDPEKKRAKHEKKLAAAKEDAEE